MPQPKYKIGDQGCATFGSDFGDIKIVNIKKGWFEYKYLCIYKVIQRSLIDNSVVKERHNIAWIGEHRIFRI